VIDDEESVLSVVEAYLKAEDYEVHVAHDGEQGLAVFKRYEPELVILDIMLPRIEHISSIRLGRINHEKKDSGYWWNRFIGSTCI
jgi:DNA-binding response OmpR family regulator